MRIYIRTSITLSLSYFIPLQLNSDAQKHDVTLLYCGLNEAVLNVIENDEIFRKAIPKSILRSSVNDGLLYLSTLQNV
ncbi:hypothetical protein Y032_0306g1988 [Ancylostoma ceylanicum]|nr:hypothetical protein Y032_0306g1988 [Ancylostoma ceylanicum]